MTRVYAIKKVSAADLRAEGILDVGCASGTSVLYVRTRRRLHLFHVQSMPDRALDDYAIQLAVTWIDMGASLEQVARNLGVDDRNLSRDLAAAGYVRLRSPAVQQRCHARLHGGNRRAKLMRVAGPPS